MTLKAHPQTLPMGRESNDNQDKTELSLQESSTINTMSTKPTQSELTSPWPDQWRLEELGDDITDLEDPWPGLEGTNVWNETSEIEEPDLTNNTPDATPWGLFREPRWIIELDNAMEPKPEEDPLPLTLHHPDTDDELKLEGELSPQTLHKVTNQKGTLSLQNDQCNKPNDKEIPDQRNPENKSSGSASGDEERTANTNHHLT